MAIDIRVGGVKIGVVTCFESASPEGEPCPKSYVFKPEVFKRTGIFIDLGKVIVYPVLEVLCARGAQEEAEK